MSQVSTPAQEPKETPHELLADTLDRDHNVERLAKMAAVKSLARNLSNEDEAAERNVLAHEEALHGIKAPEDKETEGDEMIGSHVMVAGDLTINQGGPQATPPSDSNQKPQDPHPEPPAPDRGPEPEPPDPSFWQRYGWPIAAVGAVPVGFGLGWLADKALTPPAPLPQNRVDSVNEYELGGRPPGRTQGARP